MRATVVVMLLAVSAWCGGCGSEAGPTDDEPFGVSGTYATVSTLGENSCGTVTVQNNPTVVTQSAGSSALTIAHATQTYGGTVAADGTFTTQPLLVVVGTDRFTITISGRFTGDALAADVRLDVTRQDGSTCRYVVHWAGSRP